MLGFRFRRHLPFQAEAGSADPGLCVKAKNCALFAESFVQHVLNGSYGDGEQGAEEAGTVLYKLCIKLQKRSQAGIRSILATIRDAITRLEQTGRAESSIEALFLLYDSVATHTLHNLSTQQQEPAFVLQSELLYRFKQMVRGRKWRSTTLLRKVALRRILTYMEQEESLQRCHPLSDGLRQYSWSSLLLQLPAERTSADASNSLWLKVGNRFARSVSSDIASLEHAEAIARGGKSMQQSASSSIETTTETRRSDDSRENLISAVMQQPSARKRRRSSAMLHVHVVASDTAEYTQTSTNTTTARPALQPLSPHCPSAQASVKAAVNPGRMDRENGCSGAKTQCTASSIKLQSGAIATGLTPAPIKSASPTKRRSKASSAVLEGELKETRASLQDFMQSLQVNDSADSDQAAHLLRHWGQSVTCSPD